MPSVDKQNFYGYNKALNQLSKRLRNIGTKGEACLWKYVLRAGIMKGYAFNRQRPVLNYIADFMCKELMLIIEVDGITHDSERALEYDQKRQGDLEAAGFTVLRFTNDDVLRDIRNVSRAIEQWIETKENK